MIPYMYLMNGGGGILSHKEMQYNYSMKIFNRGAKPIRISSFRINGNSTVPPKRQMYVLLND